MQSVAKKTKTTTEAPARLRLVSEPAADAVARRAGVYAAQTVQRIEIARKLMTHLYAIVDDVAPNDAREAASRFAEAILALYLVDGDARVLAAVEGCVKLPEIDDDGEIVTTKGVRS